VSATGSNLGVTVGVLIVLLTALAFGGLHGLLAVVVGGSVVVAFAALLFGWASNGHH
jgi:hypothetical protein